MKIVVFALTLFLLPLPSEAFPNITTLPNCPVPGNTCLVGNGPGALGDPDSPPQVPGPLPLLGAGAAFGWSRRMRKHIKRRLP